MNSPEFIQEWKELIELTGGDLRLLVDAKESLKSEYKRVNHFKEWIKKYHESKNTEQGESNNQWSRARRDVLTGSQASEISRIYKDMFNNLGPQYRNYDISRIRQQEHDEESDSDSSEGPPPLVQNEEDNLPPLEDDISDTGSPELMPRRLQQLVGRAIRNTSSRPRNVMTIPFYIDQPGIRRSTRSEYLPNWHSDTSEFIELRRRSQDRSSIEYINNGQLRELPENDITLVMAQVNCTRQQAINALDQNNGDIVNAIMSLQF